MRRFFLIFNLLIVVVITSVGGAYLWLNYAFNQFGPLRNPSTVIIPKGMSSKDIAIKLKRKGVINDRHTFEWGWRLLSSRKALRAGEFIFKPRMSAAGVVAHLQTGKTVLRKITIAEGLNNREVVKILADTSGLTGIIGELQEEGRLLPETYFFSYGDSRASIIKRMRDAMARLLTDAWSKRAPNLPLQNLHEVLVLASIVEKETGISSERSRVAGVFLNRLRLGMRLQSDPTVIFGITGGNGPLGRTITRSDLRSKTAYNTYLIDGLPPDPITNPGRASILAVLNPANTQDLYFVADGTGGHAFSRSLKSHIRNVERWRKIERMRRKADN